MSTACFTCGALCVILLLIILSNIMTSKRFSNYKGNCIHINDTKLFAHRGYINEYPENSYQSITNAFSKGIISEFDLRLTFDDQIVIFHDSNTKTLSNIDGYIRNMTLNNIENKILISDGITKETYIPTFKQLLKTLCTLDNINTLFLDLKTDFPPDFSADKKLVDVMFDNLKHSKCGSKKIDYIISSSNPIVLNKVRSEFESKYKQLGTLTTMWILANSGYSIIDVFIYLLLRSRLWYYCFMQYPPNAIGFFYEFYFQHTALMKSFRNDLKMCTGFGINYLKTWKLGKDALDVNYRINYLKENNVTVNIVIDHYDSDIWTQIIQKRYNKDPYVKYNGGNVKSIFVLLVTIFMTLFIHSILQVV
eukprot:153125_1